MKPIWGDGPLGNLPDRSRYAQPKTRGATTRYYRCLLSYQPQPMMDSYASNTSETDGTAREDAHPGRENADRSCQRQRRRRKNHSCREPGDRARADGRRGWADGRRRLRTQRAVDAGHRGAAARDQRTSNPSRRSLWLGDDFHGPAGARPQADDLARGHVAHWGAAVFVHGAMWRAGA